MDSLILKTNYDNNTEEESRIYCNELDAIKVHECDEKSIINVIDALIVQIPKFNPDLRSKSHQMVLKTVDHTRKMIEGKLTDKVQDSIINLMKTIMKSGWTVINGDLLNSMMLCFGDSYFENLDQNRLGNHLSLFDQLDLTISPLEIKANQDYLRIKQRDFCLHMFFYKIKDSLFENHPELFHGFSRKLYLSSWISNDSETDIYSKIMHRLNKNLRKIYLKFAENFVKLFSDITDKLIQEDIATSAGKKMIIEFYSSCSPVLKNSKENMEIMMDKWAKALFDLSKLNKDWMIPILQDLSREIYYIDSKQQAGAFKNCSYLINDVFDYLWTLVDRYPQKADVSDIPYNDRISKCCDLIKAMTKVFLQFTMKTPEHFEKFIPLLEKFISINTREASEIFTNSFQNVDKAFQEFLRNNPLQFVRLIDQCLVTAQAAALREDSSIPYPSNLRIFDYQDVYECITKFGKLSKAFNSPIVQNSMRLNFLKVFNQYSLTISIFLGGFSSYLIFKNYTVDQMIEFIQAIHVMMSTDLFALLNPNTMSMGNLLKNIAEAIMQSGKKLAAAIPELFKICELCLKSGLQWENSDDLPSHNTNSFVLHLVFHQILLTKTSGAYPVQFYSLLFETINASDESHDYFSAWVSYASMIPRQCSTPELLIVGIPNIIKLVERIMDTNLSSNIYMLLDGLQVILTTKPSAALDYLTDIESFLTSLDAGLNLLPVIQILNLVYGDYPEKINPEVVSILGERIDIDTSNAYHIGTFLNTVSRTHPHLLKPMIDKLIEGLEGNKLSLVTPFGGIVTNIVKHDPAFGEVVFPIYKNQIENNLDDNTYVMMLLLGLRSLGLLRHDLLVELKTDIEFWQNSNTAFHDNCQHLLDVIADRSLAQLDNELNAQGKAIDKLDNQLEDQKEQVSGISKEVNQQKEILNDVNQRVDNTVDRLDDLESDVNELGEKVEEIDLKSVSHAPKWAREVSKLLNPESNEDWRLLSSRLGYSSEDIQAWATHADPCMSLLSDWFAVRRKVEATRSVLEQLIEMNRTDAAKIVEDALIVAESLVSDDDPAEFITPPPIFLSYQWAVQEEVKVLREHLQKAGFRCWMDIGQMGGGDKLYEAIDRGIRGAAVFISCVTKKYSESPNCKRELNLAIGLQKPVIPLQMERMEWPPVGTMGPLLTEYIFIRMFGKSGQDIVPGTFWPYDRFQELLMQIRYSCAPEYDIIDESYQNWWQPPEVSVQYQPKVSKETAPADHKPTETDKIVHESPQLFLSYQWGKQEQVKKLYSVLMGLGFSCWMDIYQMGGGDSLYDKIDKGLRNCKIMISCVTRKYGESANCRREVSLCDSLRKPLIPILLERMSWPPEGPMSMILSQLLYISFVDIAEEQYTWNGKSTENLLNQINQILTPTRSITVSNPVDDAFIQDKAGEKQTKETDEKVVAKGMDSTDVKKAVLLS